jgi:purine-nucleoside phosphorylase
MEAATLLTIAARHEVRAACLLAVSDLLSTAPHGHPTERIRIGTEQLDEAAGLLGRLAVAALAEAG